MGAGMRAMVSGRARRAARRSGIGGARSGIGGATARAVPPARAVPAARAVPTATLVGVLLAAVWMASSAHALGVSKWEAGTCKESSCTDGGPTSSFYTQAAGHPDFGITDFRFKSKVVGPDHEEPEGKVKDVRVDLPPGLAINPEATPKCSEQQLNDLECPSDTQVGEDEATGTASLLSLLGLGLTVTEDFPVFNIERRPGQPARFGVEIKSPTLDTLAALGHDIEGHIYLEGGISWHHEPETSETSGVPSGDYHEFFKIQDIPEEPEVIESRLIFWGVPQDHQEAPTEPPSAFITLPSTCSSRPVTYLHVDSYEEPGNFQRYTNETPVAATGCTSLAFDPTLSLSPETSQSDAPDGVSVGLHVPQSTAEPAKPSSPDVQSVQVTLPEGMTLDPSAASGLVACSDGEYEAGGCPEAAKIGAVSVDAPGIPPGSLAGGVYVGAPEAAMGPESGGMYRLFVIADASQYGVGLRLEGRVSANARTGRLTATFSGAPQLPFEDFTLHFDGGPRAPLANPLSCGALAPTGAVLPYGGEPAKAPGASGFAVGGCASPLPFSPSQSLTPLTARAGAFSPFTFDLARAPGQQYLSQITTTLPPGLVAAIPSVALCGEPQANAGSCPSSSRIGTVTVAAGAGSAPYTFSGQAYLTGPYGGDPYGLSVLVPANAGPYDLGDVVTRAGIGVGLYSGRVTVTSALPSIVGGVPLRLQSLRVDVNRARFASNPTSCSPLAGESTLLSTFGASDSLSSPFQATDCGALAFKPSLGIRTKAHPTKLGGASIEVTLTQGAGQANIRELQIQLPKQLVARFATLQKSCPAATFETGPPPGGCASGARVGTVSVTTPVLPGRLTGSAWFVSHGAEAFPDLDLVLSGDGVEVVLVGHTHIAHSSVTTSTYEDLPDVPISDVTVSLPMGPNSALAANGQLCRAKLLAPSTIVGQDGAKLARSTRVAVSGCSIELLSHRIRRRRLQLTVWAPEAGRISIGIPGMRTLKTAQVRKPGDVKLGALLPPRAMTAAPGHHGPRLRIDFAPRSGHNGSAVQLVLR